MEPTTLIMISQEEWNAFKNIQADILERVKGLNTKAPAGIPVNHITAKEFMDAVRIRRTKFDQLIQSNKINIIKKKRKIYVPVKEVERYFNDPLIQ